MVVVVVVGNLSQVLEGKPIENRFWRGVGVPIENKFWGGNLSKTGSGGHTYRKQVLAWFAWVAI